jgi:hypothetical protein
MNARLRSGLTRVAALGAALLVIAVLLAPSAGAVERETTAAAAQYPRNADEQRVLGDESEEQPSASEPAVQIPLGEETPPGQAGAPDIDTIGPGSATENGRGGGGERRLAFTGYAAIPVLLLGVLLVLSGLALRRRTAAAPA